jgi:hypothetical protein
LQDTHDVGRSLRLVLRGIIVPCGIVSGGCFVKPVVFRRSCATIGRPSI